ncbi:MAG: hypothetical protein JXQ81_02405 [Desulfuromonadales bacterium]|nr:hypothetical protein [Desulfuromonadales bacterium]MBN2791338.1 hypothetical protein [Desulfuromonadales bacterium]
MHDSKAIVRRPGRSIVHGLSTSVHTTLDYGKALAQHDQYIQALEYCGLNVAVLDCLEAYPDSTFIEDVAVLTPDCAIITAPGAPSRKGEVQSIEAVLKSYYVDIEKIHAPGTLEGGDVLSIGRCFYIGLSKRTNPSGADQLVNILKTYGMIGIPVPQRGFLHLKTAVTYVGRNSLLVAEGFDLPKQFEEFETIQVPRAEYPAANCILMNDKILMPAGFPDTRKRLESLDTEIVEVDISEFAKIDGGLTCLSLRF